MPEQGALPGACHILALGRRDKPLLWPGRTAAPPPWRAPRPPIALTNVLIFDGKSTGSSRAGAW